MEGPLVHGWTHGVSSKETEPGWPSSNPESEQTSWNEHCHELDWHTRLPLMLLCPCSREGGPRGRSGENWWVRVWRDQNQELITHGITVPTLLLVKVTGCSIHTVGCWRAPFMMCPSCTSCCSRKKEARLLGSDKNTFPLQKSEPRQQSTSSHGVNTRVSLFKNGIALLSNLHISVFVCVMLLS